MLVPFFRIEVTASARRSAAESLFVVGDFQDELAGVLALEKLQQSIRKSLEALNDVFARFQFARGHPSGHFAASDSVAVGVIEDHHSGHARAIDQQRQVVGWALHWAGGAVLRNRAANHDARATGEVRKSSFKNVAADVVKVNVDAVGTMRVQGFADVFVFVIDGGVEAEGPNDVLALLLAAGDAHHAAAFDFGDLAHHHAHRACGTRNDHSVALFGFAHIEKSEIGRHSRHTESAEIYRERRELRIDFGETFAITDGELLGAENSINMIANCERRIFRFHHPAQRERAHHFADLDGRYVGFSLVHPAAQ